MLDQLVAITRDHDTALILITHDIALVSEYVDDVVVMYAGIVVESGPVDGRHRSGTPPVHAGAAGVRAAGGPRGRRALGCHPRRAARSGHPDRRVSVREPVPLRDGGLPAVEPPLIVDRGAHGAACHLVVVPATVAS